jgi:mitochondrial fission protein ELM1
MCRSTGGALLVTPSRRTPPDALRALCAALGDTPAAVWDGASENPYMGILACADAFVVTADSVNMVTEACYTGRPVMVADLPGGDRKFRAFHAGMQASGCTRPFRAALETWSYPPLDEMATIAVEVMRRIGQ